MTMRVHDQEVTFNVFNSLRYLEDREECSMLSQIESWCENRSLEELLEINESDSETDSDSDEEDCEEIEMPQEIFAFKTLEIEDRKTFVPYLDIAPDLELKQLPSHLTYAFLEDSGKLPVKGISPTICQHKIIF